MDRMVRVIVVIIGLSTLREDRRIIGRPGRRFLLSMLIPASFWDVPSKQSLQGIIAVGIVQL